jgi:hypothetical protein
MKNGSFQELSSKAIASRKTKKFTSETVTGQLESDHKRAKIPTTFIALAPERLSFGSSEVDLLSGVFHIMWQDMPRPLSYGVKLTDSLSSDGNYLGCVLVCTFPQEKSISCKAI